MNRYWLVSELFYPDEVSTGYIMTEIAESLAIQREIDVICGPAGYEHNNGNAYKQLSSNIRIHRVKLPRLNKNKLFSRTLRMLLLTLKMGWKVVRKVKKGDHLILVTNPAFLLLLFRLIRRFRHFNFILIVHDVFPENLVPAGLIKKTSLLYRVFLKLYNAAYNAADHLIVLGEDMKQLVQRKVKPGKRISIIPNWGDLEEIMPLPQFDKSDYLQTNVADKIVIGFAGNIGRTQGLEEFINAFVKAANPALVLTIIGNGALRTQLEAYVQEQGCTNILFLGNRPRKEQVSFLNTCDIGLISLREGMYGLGVPSKTYNIMAAGKPLLFAGDKGAEVDLYIRKYDCGWAFSWAEEQELVQFLAGLSVNNREMLEHKGRKAYEAARADFSKNKVLNLFQQLFTSE